MSTGKWWYRRFAKLEGLLIKRFIGIMVYNYYAGKNNIFLNILFADRQMPSISMNDLSAAGFEKKRTSSK